MLLGVFSQIYPNSMESRLTPTLHAVPIESRSNSKKFYCFFPYLQQTYKNQNKKRKQVLRVRKYIVLSHIFRRHMILKKKKVSGVIIFAICSADGSCFVLLPLRIDQIFDKILFLVEERQARYCLYYLFVGNIIFPRRPNLWRIIFLVEEILCLWTIPNVIFLWGSITSPQILKYYLCRQEILYSAPFTLVQSVWIQNHQGN